jgi:hypothetical protein
MVNSSGEYITMSQDEFSKFCWYFSIESSQVLRRKILLCLPFYRWGNRGWNRGTDVEQLPRVISLWHHGVRTQNLAAWLHIVLLLPPCCALVSVQALLLVTDWLSVLLRVTAGAGLARMLREPFLSAYYVQGAAVANSTDSMPCHQESQNAIRGQTLFSQSRSLLSCGLSQRIHEDLQGTS